MNKIGIVMWGCFLMIASSKASLIVNGDFTSSMYTGSNKLYANVIDQGWNAKNAGSGGWAIDASNENAISDPSNKANDFNIAQINTVGSESGGLVTIAFDWTPAAGATGDVLSLDYSLVGWTTTDSTTNNTGLWLIGDDGGHAEAISHGSANGFTAYDLIAGTAGTSSANATQMKLAATSVVGAAGVLTNYSLTFNLSGDVLDISAMDWVGISFSQPSATDIGGGILDNVSISITQINAPSDLTADRTTDSAGNITLNWTDNSDNETGFIIEQSTNDWVTSSIIHTTAVNGVTYFVPNSDSGDYWFKVSATNDLGISAPTSSGVDLRAFQTASGVMVEFVAYDVEAEGTVRLILLDGNGEPVWSDAVDVMAAPQFFARFLVPGLELGQSYSFRLRDEVGKWWDASGVTVESFATEMTSATLSGVTLTFDCLANHEYEIQWVPNLGSAWQRVDTVLATGSKISVVVEHPDPDGASGFFRVELK